MLQRKKNAFTRCGAPKMVESVGGLALPTSGKISAGAHASSHQIDMWTAVRLFNVITKRASKNYRVLRTQTTYDVIIFEFQGALPSSLPWAPMNSVLSV